MRIATTFVISFIISLFLIIYERKAYKKHMLKSFFTFWATIEVLVVLVAIQVLGTLGLLNIL